MDIVCNIDNRYIKPCAVMLTSLFENNKEECFVIHIISSDLSDTLQCHLRELIETKYHQQMCLYLIGEDMLQDCAVRDGSYISVVTYFRLFIENILPTTLSKVIYLDCDLVVVGSVKDLWNVDISTCALGCVEDMWSGKENNYVRLHYSSSYSYFNAGVLLINLDYWRKVKFKQLAIEYIRQYGDELVFNDQDVLNGLLYNQKQFIPFRYNLQDGFYRSKRKIQRSSVEELDKELQTPVIIHYTGSKKPWSYKSRHPYKSEYFKYLDLTHWKGERPSIPFKFRIKLAVEEFLYTLRLSVTKYRR